MEPFSIEIFYNLKEIKVLIVLFVLIETFFSFV